MEIFSWVIAVLSLVSALVAWLVKLRWSSEFAKAKDAQIDGLKARIAELEHMNPARVKEYNELLRGQLEKYNDELKAKLDETERALNEKADQVQAEERTERQALYQGLAVMSHEWRTPLNGILGFADLLLERLPKESKEYEYCNIIRDSGWRLLLLMNPLLNFESIIKIGNEFRDGKRNYRSDLIETLGEDFSDELLAKLEDNPLRILFASSNPVNRRLFLSMMERSRVNYELVEVYDGEKCIEKVQDRAFDLVVMNMTLGEIGGLEVTRAIRRHERETGRRPVLIALTVPSAREIDEKIFVEAGVDFSIFLPVTHYAMTPVLAKSISIRELDDL